MATPLPFIEQQLARKAELLQRIEMMRNHLAGASENAVGLGVNYEDVTQEAIDDAEAEIADIDASIAKLAGGHA